jgi:hypothetical protein
MEIRESLQGVTLMDINLPGISGVQATKTVPVLAMAQMPRAETSGEAGRLEYSAISRSSWKQRTWRWKSQEAGPRLVRDLND